MHNYNPLFLTLQLNLQLTCEKINYLMNRHYYKLEYIVVIISDITHIVNYRFFSAGDRSATGIQ